MLHSTVEAYDPATDTWTRKADMPTVRINHVACVIDGRIYVFAGRTKWGDAESSVPTVEVYDPAADTWTQASDMPTSRSFHTASVVDGKMYIIGGKTSASSRIVDVYDPRTNMWTTAPDLPTPRWYHTANVVDGKIYAIGGTGGPIPVNPALSIVYEFDLGLPVVISSVSPGGKLLETWGEVKSE